MAWEKKVSQADAVKAFLVTVDSKVDLEASVDKFRSVALKTLAGQESEDSLIATCMLALFDHYKGATLNLDFIKSQTVQRMAKVVPELGEPGIYSVVSSRVEEILHALCDQPEVEAKGNKPAVAAITDRTFAMKKGKGGGFYKKSDQGAAATKA